MDDGYSGTSLVTDLGWGLARALAAAALPLPALAATLAVAAGFAGLEGLDLAAVSMTRAWEAWLSALKSFLLCGHPEQIKLVGNFSAI